MSDESRPHDTSRTGSSKYIESVGFLANAEMAFALAKGQLIPVPSPGK